MPVDKDTQWPEVRIFRVEDDEGPDWFGIARLAEGIHAHEERYLPISSIRERLTALLDAETLEYRQDGEAGDMDGARVCGAACDAFRAALAAFPDTKDKG